jgi:hypothetical protein
MPPMFVVKGKTARSVYGFNTKVAPEGSRWCWQPNGWMDDTIGERWFNDIFLQNCGTERPQLLILDGHSSHETLGILMRAMEENIHILALPPHTTHALQPLDKTVFGPLNRAYNEACSNFMQANPLNQVNKWSFPGLFAQAWETAVTVVNIQSGFRSCGIYPLNNSIIPDAAFGPSEPTDVPLPDPQIQQKEPDGQQCQSTVNVLPELLLYEATPMEDENDTPITFDDSAVISQDEYLAPILDISDPHQLFELISDENVVINPLIDGAAMP